jgi:hypothetical protein
MSNVMMVYRKETQMGYYDLRMFHGSKELPDVRFAWVPFCSHPPVGAVIGEWQIVEILENDTPEVYRVRVEPAPPTASGVSGA